MTATDTNAPTPPAQQQTEKPSPQPDQAPRPVINQPAYEKKKADDGPIVKRYR